MTTLKTLGLGLTLAVVTAPMQHVFAEENARATMVGYTSSVSDFNALAAMAVTGKNGSIEIPQNTRGGYSDGLMDNPASEKRALVLVAKQVFPKPQHIVLRNHKVMEVKNRRSIGAYRF